ncbi:hypothetical protein [Streptomyces sp. 900105755]
MWLWRIDAKITAVSQRQAEIERGRRALEPDLNPQELAQAFLHGALSAEAA